MSQYAGESDVNITLLAIGDDADLQRLISRLNPNPRIGYYVDHARNSNDILGKITSICNRIFNRNSLRFGNEARREFRFDLPMLELLVFAQGENVRINGITGSGSFTPSGTVNVRYSEVPATDWEHDRNVIISRNLTGIITSFQNIPKGSYSLDIDGGQTVEIYYKPSVTIDIRLYQRGRQVRSQDITEGNYQIRFGIVEYEATIQNDGQTISIKSGGTINIKEGNFTVYVKAHFLGINTAENSITGNVFPPPALKEILLDILKQFWYIFALLLALLLYWFLWGRKKRFPRRQMANRPIIQETIGKGVSNSIPLDADPGYLGHEDLRIDFKRHYDKIIYNYEDAVLQYYELANSFNIYNETTKIKELLHSEISSRNSALIEVSYKLRSHIDNEIEEYSRIGDIPTDSPFLLELQNLKKEARLLQNNIDESADNFRKLTMTYNEENQLNNLLKQVRHEFKNLEKQLNEIDEKCNKVVR